MNPSRSIETQSTHPKPKLCINLHMFCTLCLISALVQIVNTIDKYNNYIFVQLLIIYTMRYIWYTYIHIYIAYFVKNIQIFTIVKIVEVINHKFSIHVYNYDTLAHGLNRVYNFVQICIYM